MGNNKQNVLKANFIQLRWVSNILKQIHAEAASFLIKIVSSQAGDGGTYLLLGKATTAMTYLK